jgi:membrane protein required for colicin V production
MILDIVLAVVILGFFLTGLTRGIVRSMFGLMGIIIGLIVASRFYANFVIATELKWQYAKILSFIVVFLIVFLLIYLIGFIIQNLLSSLKLGFLDHILGAALGLLKGSIFAWLICFVMLMFPDGNEKIKQSRIAPFVFKELNWLENFCPLNVKDKLKLDKPNTVIDVLTPVTKTIANTEKARTSTKSISRRNAAMDSAYNETK